MNICELLENNNNSLNEETTPNEEQSKNEQTEITTPTNDEVENETQSSESEQEMFALFSDIEPKNNTINNSNNNDNNNLLTSMSSNNYYNENENNNNNNTSENSSLNYILSSSIFANPSQQEYTSSSNNNNNNNESNTSYSNIDNNSIDFGNSMLSTSNEDEFNFDRLNPFEKLCSLCDNPTPSNMESASKYIVPALEFCATLDDFMRTFSYLKKFCFFPDILLRSIWLEQIQSVIQYVHQEGENIPIDFKDFNMSYELAVLISNVMQEPTYQVKKYATASLLCIVERRLLDNDQIEKIIIPSLLNLVKENNEDFHIDCVSLFGKLAPLIGRDLTTKYFLEPFCRLCSSPVFHTRKACASNITEMASIVSMHEVEKFLLPHFCEFMKDQVWAIRKVCADMFSTFASKCSRKTRDRVLTEYFIKLLDDTSRWVKISAYKSLGSFIATFSLANSNQNEIEEGEQEIEKNESKNNETENKSADSNSNEETKKLETEGMSEKIKELIIKSNNNEEIKNSNETKIENQETEYTNFMYWRNSLPNLDDKIEEIPNKSEEETTKTEPSPAPAPTPTPTNQESDSQKSNITNYIGNLYSSTNTLSLYSNVVQQQMSPYPNYMKPIDFVQLSEVLKQDIVPPILLSYFVSMVEINAQNSLDAEMNYNCAYNFPAIIFTIGLANWKYLRNLYKKLAEDNNWKVRQTLAYSIHEVAIILGTELTQAELVPIFDSFIKDVDEIRMGIVSNLSKFLRVLSLDYRKSYMPKLNDFLKMDNQRNWRFRNELGIQVAEFVELFPTDCIAEFIQPVTFILALDKVAEVRLTAIRALTLILKQFELNPDDPYNKNYRRNFIDDIIRTFANNNKWSFRQLYVVICDLILKERAYSDINAFCIDFLPKLFSFRNDKVPNIRVCLAKVIANHMLTTDYFLNENTHIANELEITLQYLSGDKDEDVQNYVKSTSYKFSEKANSFETTSSSLEIQSNESSTY